MTASSTDAYGNGNAKISEDIPLFSTYPVVSVTTDHNNFWPTDPSSNSTSPSSEHNWEVDEEEVIKRRIYELKRQFHNGRYLLVKHLPRDATEEDVRDLLKGHFVHSVQLQQTSGTAKVLLAEPEVLETWTKSTQHTLKGNKVVISPANTEGLLCVAKLPLDYSEDEFSLLLSTWGEVNYFFLMRSEKSGDSKNYGFVEYANKEIAMQAKSALDGRELRDTILVCDWLDQSHVTFASLHSKCLFVDKLPKDYRDMGEFRRIFSKIKNPIYCQIAMKQGALQDWGLVEFDSGEDAEETRNSLNNFMLRGQPIRVEYYVPGVRAVNIYMKMLSDQEQKRKAALLPEPPTNKVFVQLKNLTKHNPAFAKSLQNIILTQIQTLQEKSRSCTPVESVMRPDIPPVNPLSRMPRTIPDRPALLNFMHLLPPVAPPTPRLASSPQPPLNSNAQAALVILLAAQLQQQQGGNNILSNPQVLKLLQTLVSQGDPNQTNAPPAGASSSSTSLSSSLKANFRNGYFKGASNKLIKGPLLPTPDMSSGQWKPELDVDRSVGPILDGILDTPNDSQPNNLTESISTLLSNAQNLQQLLGSLSAESAAMNTVASLPMNVSVASAMPPPPANSALLGPPPALYDPTQSVNPLMSMMMPDPVIPEQFLGPVPPQGPYLLANPPVSCRNTATSTSWAQSIAPQPIFHHSAPLFSAAGPPLPPRLFSPIYIPSGALSQHGILGQPVNPPQINMKGFTTPGGQKRKHFLPSPEASPENGYVGQHSQGIGGHYQDSYARKKKKH